jgi:hypothetical protein
MAKKRRLPMLLLVAATCLVVLVALADAFIAPPAHDVHSVGGSSVQLSAYDSTSTVWWMTGPPTQSLPSVKCLDIGPNGRAPCAASDLASAFPTLQQTKNTLYFVWSGCVDWSGSGAVIPWAGYNAEFTASTRTVVLHCYLGTPWIYTPERLFGSRVAGGLNLLLAIPTSDLGAGSLQIREDDRLEHLIGDQSTEYELATATIT